MIVAKIDFYRNVSLLAHSLATLIPVFFSMLRAPILLHGLQPSLLLLIVSQSYTLKNPFFCSSVQQLGQLASKDELSSEEVATIHTEKVRTVDEEAEDEVASQCGESDSLPIPVSICSGVSSVVRALLLVCKK
jgi:hypothetical protein